MIRHLFALLLSCSLLPACNSTLPATDAPRGQTQEAGPAGAPPGTCWDKAVSPAVVETVTEQILVQPAEMHADGTILNPARYKTETRQQIVTERTETWFETPCRSTLTPQFIATLQRALNARGLYPGPVNGELDAATRSAIRTYQSVQGPDSETLSMDAARKLGLVKVSSL